MLTKIGDILDAYFLFDWINVSIITEFKRDCINNSDDEGFWRQKSASTDDIMSQEHYRGPDSRWLKGWRVAEECLQNMFVPLDQN